MVVTLVISGSGLSAQQAIDVHSHNILPFYMEMLERHDAALEETFPLPSWDAASHVKFMETAGIEYTVLTLGPILALYPTPAVVVGTLVSGKPNWLLVGHLGIIGHDRILISMYKVHYTNQGVKETGKISVNVRWWIITRRTRLIILSAG